MVVCLVVEHLHRSQNKPFSNARVRLANRNALILASVESIYKQFGEKMISLALGDKERWDIGIDAEGNFVMLSDLSQLQQFLRNRLLFIKNEWRYNNTIGVPYYEFILIDNPNFITIESIFKKTILETKEVSKILDFSMSLQNFNLQVNFRAKSVFGVIEGSV